MPLVTQTSSRTRLAHILEVLDITDEKAIRYLTSCGVPSKVANAVVDYAGGRLVFLMKAAELREIFKDVGEDELIAKIKRELDARYVKPAILSVVRNRDYAKRLVEVRHRYSGRYFGYFGNRRSSFLFEQFGGHPHIYLLKYIRKDIISGSAVALPM